MQAIARLTTSRWIVAMALGAGLAVSTACSTSVDVQNSGSAEPVAVQIPEGSDLARITLTAKAMERTGVRVAEVRDLNGSRTAVPYSAVLYDAQGQPWVYTSIAPRTFVREKITVVSIDGRVAVLSDGPRAGTLVASVGAAELYGSELGVDH